MKNIKKIITAAACIAIASGIFSGCSEINNEDYLERTQSKSEDQTSSEEEQSQEEQSQEAEKKTSDGAWKSMAFTLEGKDMNLIKMPYAELKAAGWSFDTELYGIKTNEFLAPLGTIYERTIHVNKEGYDDGIFLIGITNFNSEPCGIEDVQLWSIEVDAHEKTSYPELVLENGITWGSDETSVIAAYGAPSLITRHDETSSTELAYTDNAGNNVILEVYDNGGVGKIIMESYF